MTGCTVYPLVCFLDDWHDDMIYRVRNLKKRYAREQGYELEIRHLQLSHGDMVAVTGPSGCGKSTMLDILGLALMPDEAEDLLFQPEGETTLDIMPLWKAGRLDHMADLRLRYMGYILQTGGLLPFLDVQGNVLLTARMLGMTVEEALDNALPLAEQLGIGQLFKAMPATLSVGERQRAAIVRALATHPRLILADEPTAALDPVHAGHVMDIFLRAVSEQHGTLVMVTHNADLARSGGLREVAFRIEDSQGATRAILDQGGELPCNG